MAFDEVQFPDSISYGSSGGPMFNTTVIVTDSGAEERVSRWTTPRRHYNVGLGVRTTDQVSSLIDFIISRKGAYTGFRYKDFADFTTASDHRGAHSDTDEIFGVGDGTETQFQLKKSYTSGLVTQSRNITKPVAGTVLVSIDDVSQPSGWTVDTTTGIVTFSAAPLAAEVLKNGCQFDVPVRFDKEAESAFSHQHEGFDVESVQGVGVIEIRDELETGDEFFYGGAAAVALALNETVVLSELIARAYELTPASTGGKAQMPDKTNRQPGGPYFFVSNLSGTQTVELIDDDGVTSMGTIAISSTVMLFLSEDGASVKTWRAML